MLPEDSFKLVQCYHCMELASHLKPDCPRKQDPQVCGRCGEMGHPARDCSAAPHCCLCGEDGHPATARICRVYKDRFAEKLAVLLDPSSSVNLPRGAPPPPRLGGSAVPPTAERVLETLQDAAVAAETMQDFMNAMFNLFQVPVP